MYCWGLVSIAFIIPFAKLIYWALSYFDISQADNFFHYAYHSLSSSVIASVVCVLLALFLHFFNRLALQKSPIQQR
ncbi:FbpB, partial [Pasteurella multocida subsp. multocida str. Anand1_cattle]